MFKIGDLVWYFGTYGQNGPVATVITGVGEQNDQAVYDTDESHWGYEYQFEARKE